MTVESFNQLISKLTSSPQMNRDAVEAELSKFDLAKILPQLVDIIRDDSEPSQSRIAAIEALKWIKDPKPIAKLMDTLMFDFDNKVRIAIIELVGYLKERTLLSQLLKLVNRDDDPEIIKAASLAIQVIQGITPKWSMDS